MTASRFVEVTDEGITCFKSRCRTISRISNQFRKIEFWLIPPKEPFDITISRNDTKKSPALYIWRHSEEFENSQKNTILFIKLVEISSNFKESVRAPKTSCCLHYPHMVRRFLRLQDYVKNLSKVSFMV